MMKVKRIIYPLLFSMIFTLTACENLHSANPQGADDGTSVSEDSGSSESAALLRGAGENENALLNHIHA